MKKVLIISHSFLKTRPIARIQGLAKYLPEFGWDPILLTYGDLPDKQNKKKSLPNSESIINNATSFVNNFLNHNNNNWLIENSIKFYKNVFWYPDPYLSVRRKAINIGKSFIQNDDFDAIISSAHPVSSHLIANALVKSSNIPWIADFRDLWTQNHYYSYYRIRYFFEKYLEIDTLKNANAIVTVSKPLSEEIAKLHSNRPFYTIFNGFDPDQCKNGVQISNDFTITHTGNLYKGRRDPSLLFKVIRELIDKNLISKVKISIHFFGDSEKWLNESVRKQGLEKIVFFHGFVSKEVSIEKQRRSQILLLLKWKNPKEKGVYTSKLFEYLASGRPILSIGFPEGGIIKDLLDQTQAGEHILNEAELREYLLKAYREYKELGAVQYHGIEAEVMKYSHREMARKFAEVLDEVTK